jgi:hypothetical protein
MSSAIRDAGESLIDLLRTNLVPDVVPLAEQIAMLSPTEVNQPGAVLISLFLYSIMPAAEYRNQNEVPFLSDANQPPSMPVELYYLLTTYPQQNQDPTERTLQTHLLMGFAMRVLFDNAVITGSALRGSLPRDEELRLTFQPITVEDMTRIWSVFPGNSLRTSASYVLSPVRLLSSRALGGARVVSRQRDVDHIVPSGGVSTP